AMKLLRSPFYGNRNLFQAPWFRSRRIQWLVEGCATRSWTMTSDRARAALMLGANLVILVAMPPALAADASPWDGSERAAVRLIGGGLQRFDGLTTYRAGVEIKLAPGWKTYWRYPGDSGIPPRFDFSGSTNVKLATVKYPAPQRLTDESGVSIGYQHGVIFPLYVALLDPTKPAIVSLRIDYAVCEKICVPAEGRAELTLTGNLGEQELR